MRTSDVQREITRLTMHLTNTDELGTVEGQLEFDMKRNYHYTNTSNPVDFPRPDPKPELSPGSMRGNIEYFMAIAAKYQLKADAARRMAEFWQKELDAHQ